MDINDLIENDLIHLFDGIVFIIDFEKNKIKYLSENNHFEINCKNHILDLDNFFVKLDEKNTTVFKEINSLKTKSIEYTIKKNLKSETFYKANFKKISESIFLFHSINITEQKKIEDRSNKESNRLKALLDNTIQFYFFLENNYKILYINSKAKEFFLSVLNQNLFEGYKLIEYLPLIEREKFESCFEHAFNGVSIKYETSMLFANNVIGWFEFNFLPVYEKQKVKSICLSILDITERKKNLDNLNDLNSELINLNKSLELRVFERTQELTDEIQIRKLAEIKLIKSLEKEKELNEMKTKFISIVSHEFRTPMTVISASAQLLENYWEKYLLEDKKKHFGRIKESIKGLNDLIDSVLKANQSEREITIKNEKIILIEFIENLISKFESIYPNFEFLREFEISNTYFINSDKNLLSHILDNLLNNAIKYSASSRRIEIKLIDLNGEAFKFSVKDFGIGIPEEDYKKIGHTFFRARNVTKILGTGVGLNITKNFVERLGGIFDFSSNLGQGSEFNIVIPKSYG